MQYFIGIDGGGTNSRLLAVDVHGNVIGHVRGRSTNLESNSTSTVMNNLSALIQSFHDQHFTKYDDCLGLCFGTAGVDTKASLLTIEDLLRQIPFTCPTKVVNDAHIALYANTLGGPGLMLIAGTGSIGYGINRSGRQKRVGGFGYIVGDEGSAYWVVRQAISAALHAYDGSGPDTILVNALTRALGFNEFEEIIDFVYRKNKSDLAKLSHVVASAQEDGDAIACAIFDEALSYFKKTVEVLVADLGSDPMPLYKGGGFLMNNRFLNESFDRIVAEEFPQLCVDELKRPAEWGAVILAAELSGYSLPDLLTRGVIMS